jgi:hypothetical protein
MPKYARVVHALAGISMCGASRIMGGVGAGRVAQRVEDMQLMLRVQAIEYGLVSSLGEMHGIRI